MTSAFSWQSYVAFALLHSVLQGQIYLLLQVFLDFLLLHSNPLWWKGHLFWVLVLKGLVSLHRTFQLQLLQRYWLGYRLGLLWYWMVCLGNEQRSFCHFWDCIQVLHFRLLLTTMATPFLLMDLHTVVDIMVIWVKFTHSSPFSLLITRMSTFTLAISCSTTSNLPWVMDLTTRFLCNIALYSIGPCFYQQSHTQLGIVLLWLCPFILSGVMPPMISSSILGTYWPGEFLFQYPIILPFILFMGFSRQEYWSGLSFPSPVDHILSDLSTMTCLSWVAPHGMV